MKSSYSALTLLILFGNNNLLAEWRSTAIDLVAADQPIASLAQDGALQVSYLDKNSRTFKLALKTPATAWKISPLQPMPDNMVATHYSHQLDDQGNLHLVYANNDQALLYAHDMNNNKWSFTALAVLRESAIPMNMFRLHNNEIQYYSNASGSWRLEILSKSPVWDAIQVSLSPPAAVIDSEGREHVVYTRGSSFQGPKGIVSLGAQLLYATNKTGQWQRDKVINEGKANERQIYAPVITADLSGYLHVVYVTAIADSYTLRYATNASGRWKATDITTQDNILYPKHLAVNPLGGTIHLVYQAPASNKTISVYYVSNPRLNQWSPQLIHTVSTTSGGQSTPNATTALQSTFALDKANQPHYIFADVETATLEDFTP